MDSIKSFMSEKTFCSPIEESEIVILRNLGLTQKTSKKRIVKEAKKENFLDIINLSESIMQDLNEAGKSDFFGGVDEYEIESASHVLVALKGHKLMGFLLLEEPTQKFIDLYKEFPEDFVTRSLIINECGVKVSERGKGISTLLLNEAKRCAILTGKLGLIGTFHPDNVPSKKAINCIARTIQTGTEIDYRSRDGRLIHGKKFLAIL